MQLRLASNRPLVSIHHVFYPALRSPLRLNKDQSGFGGDTMQSPIASDVATLMYLCKEISGYWKF